MFVLFFMVVSGVITGLFCWLISRYFVSKQYILKLREVGKNKICKETKIIGNYIDINCGENYVHIIKKTKDDWYYSLNSGEEKRLEYNEPIVIGNTSFEIMAKDKIGGFSVCLPAIISLMTVYASFQQNYSITNLDKKIVENSQDDRDVEKKVEDDQLEGIGEDNVIQKTDNSEMNEIVIENDNIFQNNIPVDWSMCHNENGRFLFENIPSETGISVSVYQGEIDWGKVKSDGIDYAIIRIGSRGYESGNLYLDSRFNENMNEAKSNDIKVGAYFYSQAIDQKEMDEEIKVILDALQECPLDYPIGICLDRTNKYRTSSLSNAEYVDLIKYFCIRIKQSGYTPMIMGKEEWFKAFSEGTFDGYLKLVTNVNEAPRDIDNCIIWEYQESAQNMVDGIDKVEMSVSIYASNQSN